MRIKRMLKDKIIKIYKLKIFSEEHKQRPKKLGKDKGKNIYSEVSLMH